MCNFFFHLSDQVAFFVGSLTRDPSLICHTGMKVQIKFILIRKRKNFKHFFISILLSGSMGNSRKYPYHTMDSPTLINSPHPRVFGISKCVISPRNTLLSVSCGNSRSKPFPRLRTSNKCPPYLRNSSSKNPPCPQNSKRPSLVQYGYFLQRPNDK